MSQEPSDTEEVILSIPRSTRSIGDMLKTLNDMNILQVVRDDGRVILTIPAWSVLALLLGIFLIVRALRSSRA